MKFEGMSHCRLRPHAKSHAPRRSLDSWLPGNDMTRRGWLLFLAVGVIWGMPYMLIRIAVATIDPLVIAFGRTLIGALLLLPVALHRKALAPAFRRWLPLVAFTLVEITGPWLLIG